MFGPRKYIYEYIFAYNNNYIKVHNMYNIRFRNVITSTMVHIPTKFGSPYKNIRQRDKYKCLKISFSVQVKTKSNSTAWINYWVIFFHRSRIEQAIQSHFSFRIVQINRFLLKLIHYFTSFVSGLYRIWSSRWNTLCEKSGEYKNTINIQMVRTANTFH